MHLRHRTPFALALLVGLVACGGETPDSEMSDDPEATDAEAQAGQMASATGADLHCEPMTGRMELEGRLSPYDSTRVPVGDAEGLLCYGRPSARGRTMIGGEAVPYGSLWRTGANEPTTIHLPVAAEIAGVRVEPGTYSIYTEPGEQEWTVIVNESTGQWGHESSYTPEVAEQEVGRGTVPAGSSEEYVETLTFLSEPADGGTNLVLQWEDTRVEIPVRPVG